MRSFVGKLLITVGFLIAGLAGLCTAVFLFAFLGDFLTGRQNVLAGDLINAVSTPIIFGAGPIVIGVVLILIGRAVLKGRAR